MIRKILFLLYNSQNRRIRNFIINAIIRLENGEMYSPTLRKLFNIYHKIDIGMYTYGGCFVPDCIGPFVTIGRYCSFAINVRVFTRNHPVDTMSTHPFFFNSKLGYCKKDLAEYIPLQIGSDIWFGYGSIVIPRVTKIGHGAIIAAGAIVTDNVPPYAIVAGNPGKIVKFRHSDKCIAQLLDSRWWDKPINENMLSMTTFHTKYDIH